MDSSLFDFYPYRNEYFYVMIEKYVIIAEKVVYDKEEMSPKKILFPIPDFGRNKI